MENASKALIIAGAILLSILIISLGLMVYNQARDTIGSVNLSQQEIEVFNAKFTSYEGENVSGSQVNSLIQTVLSSNQQAINDSTGAYVGIQFPTSTNVPGAGYISVFVGVGDDNKVGYDVGSGYTAVTAVVSGQTGATAGTHDLTATPTTSAGVTCSLKVNTGKKYTVEIGYDKGRVAGIYIH